MTDRSEDARVPVPYPHPIIAREGWPFILFAGGLAVMVLFVAGPAWSALFWLITLFVLQFFRDPARSAPVDPAAVLSPADGRVMVVARDTDPYLQREALKISVFMNVFNVHSNRSPVQGRVEKAWYHEGSFLNAALDKASLENERNALWIKTDGGVDVTCVQVAGLVARRILCYVEPGDTLTRGQRYGFIRFGSRVDIYLPPTARPAVSVGDKVSATATTLARIAP